MQKKYTWLKRSHYLLECSLFLPENTVNLFPPLRKKCFGLERTEFEIEQKRVCLSSKSETHKTTIKLT